MSESVISIAPLFTAMACCCSACLASNLQPKSAHTVANTATINLVLMFLSSRLIRLFGWLAHDFAPA
jgi:hypothetical protein